MTINGIWSSELGGPYGWEPNSTLYLKDGQLHGGGRNHYSLGSYKITEQTVVMRINVTQYGKKRALFGQKSEQVNIEVKAALDGERMVGEATIPGHDVYGIYMRFIRRADEPRFN